MKSKQKILVVVAARGGSKGLKNKNIRPLCGKPLIAYTLLQAKKWGKADTIVCSTDSEKIASVAAQYGAQIPFKRPKSLSGDRVAKFEVIRHALHMSEKIYKKQFDIIVDLDVTAPLRRTADLEACLQTFTKYKPQTLFSVVACHRNPYFNVVEINPDGRARLSKQLSQQVTTRQSAPKVFDMNASIYFYRRQYLVKESNTTVISPHARVHCMDQISRFDIDSELDFKFIEFLMQKGVWESEV